MPQVVIVGAGPLGGELAFLLARGDVVESIVLVDEVGQVAAGKALDIRQAGPVESFSTHVSGSSDLYVATGAPIVVIADDAGGDEWQGDAALHAMGRFVRPASSHLIVCAGAGHADLVDVAVGRLGMNRVRVFGTAPEGLVSGLRALTALEADRSPSEVALTVLGRPPHHAVVPWEDATIGGLAATRVLDEPARRRLAARVSPLWPPGPLTLAAAAAAAIRCVLGQSRRTISAFVAPDDSSGKTRRTSAVPIVLGPLGIERVELPSGSLSNHDQVGLDNAQLL